MSREAGRDDRRMPVDTRADPEALRGRFDATVLVHLDAVFRLAFWLKGNRAEAEDPEWRLPPA